MKRAFFQAVGIACFLFGLQCLAVDEFHVTRQTAVRSNGFMAQASTTEMRTVTTQEWWPWAGLSIGAVLLLWTSNIGKGK